MSTSNSGSPVRTLCPVVTKTFVTTPFNGVPAAMFSGVLEGGEVVALL